MSEPLFPCRVTILAHGDIAKVSTVFEVGRDYVQQVLDPDNHGPEAWLDWYNDRLQIHIYASDSDEPAVTVCFNPDGTIAHDQDAWRAERDAPKHTP